MANHYKAVAQLPSDPGPAGWNELLPTRVPYAALEGIHTADYVVIGAGFTGLSAAMRLAELNPKKTTVL